MDVAALYISLRSLIPLVPIMSHHAMTSMTLYNTVSLTTQYRKRIETEIAALNVDPNSITAQWNT